jgi:hypothetical protein
MILSALLGLALGAETELAPFSTALFPNAHLLDKGEVLIRPVGGASSVTVHERVELSTELIPLFNRGNLGVKVAAGEPGEVVLAGTLSGSFTYDSAERPEHDVSAALLASAALGDHASVHGGIGLSRGTWVTVSGDIKLLRTLFDSLGLELPPPNTVVTDYLQVPLSLSLLLPLGPHAVVQLGGHTDLLSLAQDVPNQHIGMMWSRSWDRAGFGLGLGQRWGEVHSGFLQNQPVRAASLPYPTGTFWMQL